MAVPPEMVDAVWPLVSPLVQSALPRADGRLTLLDAQTGCREGRYVLWAMGAEGEKLGAVALSEILQYTTKKVFSIFLYAGARVRFEGLWPRIEAIAREAGCSELQIAGPRAWQRLYPQFREAFTVFTKEIT